METIKGYISVVGGLLGLLIGGFDGLILVLFIFVTMDFFTGFLVGLKKKEISSEIMFWGGVKKLGIFILVSISHLIDIYIIKEGSMLRTATLLFYITGEGLSLLENWGKLGLYIPKKLKDTLEQLKNEE